MIKKSRPTIQARYEQLVSVFQELASILNTEQLLERIVDAAIELSDAESAWILVPYQIHHTLILETGRFPDNSSHRGHSTPLNTSLEGWVFSNQQPMMISDAGLYDHGYGDFIDIPGVEIKSLLAIPITVKGKQIGILEVVNNRAGEFTKVEQDILVSFANQVAIYIDNTHRFLQTDLITELVHELHTPLAALNTALFLLQRSDLQEDRRQQISEMVHNEFSRLTELTTSFLDYARMESGRTKFKPTQFDLNQLIIESTAIIQMQLESKGMTISLDLPTQSLMITADRDKIKQVVLNLLSNAMKYNSPNGNIKISTTGISTDVSFSIRDSGPGIPPEYLPRLFERFYRLPTAEKGPKGTGLGLTICKQIVDAHNGKIEVASTVGQGTTFTVQLPLNL